VIDRIRVSKLAKSDASRTAATAKPDELHLPGPPPPSARIPNRDVALD
jgi:hypothetical protein